MGEPHISFRLLPLPPRPGKAYFFCVVYTDEQDGVNVEGQVKLKETKGKNLVLRILMILFFWLLSIICLRKRYEVWVCRTGWVGMKEQKKKGGQKAKGFCEPTITLFTQQVNLMNKLWICCLRLHISYEEARDLLKCGWEMYRLCAHLRYSSTYIHNSCKMCSEGLGSWNAKTIEQCCAVDVDCGLKLVRRYPWKEWAVSISI